MKRGDIVVGASDGDFGKPRPVLVVQSDALNETHQSVIVCPLTSELRDLSYRIPVEPGDLSGLRERSEIMVDKVQAIRRDKIRQTIGRVTPQTLEAVERTLTIVLGLGERPVQA